MFEVTHISRDPLGHDRTPRRLQSLLYHPVHPIHLWLLINVPNSHMSEHIIPRLAHSSSVSKHRYRLQISLCRYLSPIHFTGASLLRNGKLLRYRGVFHPECRMMDVVLHLQSVLLLPHLTCSLWVPEVGAVLSQVSVHLRRLGTCHASRNYLDHRSPSSSGDLFVLNLVTSTEFL